METIVTNFYDIHVHSDFFVEILGPAGQTTLEYDDAADFAEKVRESPELSESFAGLAVEAFGVDE